MRRSRCFSEHEVAADPRVAIGKHAWYRQEGDLRVAFAYGLPLLQYSRGDVVLERLAMAELVEIGAAKIHPVARAFGVHRTTVHRCRKLFLDPQGLRVVAQAGLAGHDG